MRSSSSYHCRLPPLLAAWLVRSAWWRVAAPPAFYEAGALEPLVRRSRSALLVSARPCSRLVLLVRGLRSWAGDARAAAVRSSSLL